MDRPGAAAEARDDILAFPGLARVKRAIHVRVEPCRHPVGVAIEVASGPGDGAIALAPGVWVKVTHRTIGDPAEPSAPPAPARARSSRS